EYMDLVGSVSVREGSYEMEVALSVAAHDDGGITADQARIVHRAYIEQDGSAVGLDLCLAEVGCRFASDNHAALADDSDFLVALRSQGAEERPERQRDVPSEDDGDNEVRDDQGRGHR